MNDHINKLYLGEMHFIFCCHNNYLGGERLCCCDQTEAQSEGRAQCDETAETKLARRGARASEAVSRTRRHKRAEGAGVWGRGVESEVGRSGRQKQSVPRVYQD